MQKQNLNIEPALITLALRGVLGWTYFSAFWRRTVLMDKLDPDLPGYIGEKFNHFLPHALGIKPLIQYLLEHPDLLWINMVAFTVIEGIVGLLIILGLFTRLMSVGVFSLALGILLGSGWLGTTCLDEWQIGILGLAGAVAIFLSGGGYYSLDRLWQKRNFPGAQQPWYRWLASGPLPWSLSTQRGVALIGAGAILVLSLYTNQVFHGGLWGPLHNKSVKPELELSEVSLRQGRLQFELFRTEGVDVYGAWIIALELRSLGGETLFQLEGREWATLPESAIDNYYIASVKTGPHSLVVPLGAKARLSLVDPALADLPPGAYSLLLTDVSGARWQHAISVN